MKKCYKCKNINIQQLYWVDPNTKEIIDPLNCNNDSDNDKWCEDCGNDTKFIDE